jgi:hypothetical protein
MTKTTIRLPDPLWKQTRIRALEEGRDAQDLVADALTAYLSARKKGVAR